MNRRPHVGAVVLLLTMMPLAAAAGPAAEPQTSPSPLRVRPGDVFVLRPPPGKAIPVSASFLGKVYPAVTLAGETGPVFLVGSDMEARAGGETAVVVRADGSEERLPVALGKRKYAEERLTLPPALVTPPKELEERIAREQEQAAAVYRDASGPALWGRGFARAIDEKAAGNFGRRRILNGIPKSPHAGQDYTAAAGTPVRAIAAGTVRLARDFYYSGLTLLVDHGAGLVSQYLHLEKMLVAEGDRVTAGQMIGRVGSTGRATGPHLHLGARLFEQRVDPESLWGLFGGGGR